MDSITDHEPVRGIQAMVREWARGPVIHGHGDMLQKSLKRSENIPNWQRPISDFETIILIKRRKMVKTKSDNSYSIL